MMKSIIPLIFGIAILFSQKSISYGTVSLGKLENGVKLPLKGENYKSYSSLGSLLGRTYVNSIVRDITIEAYDSLYQVYPEKVFVYGETGFKEGGQFKPHRTHRNGLSVDYMVPVTDIRSKSIPLPTSIFEKFGYNIEFDEIGEKEKYKIDFEAVGAHIYFLNEISNLKGYGIAKVIFDPSLQTLLFSTKYGDYLKQHVIFSKTRAWVRHDDHYHVNFNIPTKPL